MQLTDSLAQAETALQALSAALAGTDANVLELRSTELRDAFMSLAVLRQQHTRSGQMLDAALRERIEAVGRQIGPLREQLARASALTGSKVATLLPMQSAAPTYDALSGRAARTGPARIYRSAS
ncbi:hypothetical protein [Comamonas endophytica]|uniref:Flagellar protein FlgN n=1 Tax=Comamonas endophytica TaxID=2949090 RepID=A0ABY6GE12_9BURK|nr:MULTISPECIES: hypothetical protein [unclassified Acidovorax]MCD2512729.1 hypothetical protein [Acidovorax sp. D4N7]UYG52920.1 hypothetical protein M9799_06745 [Acidovorax sp. 5MLIR]